MKKFTSNAFVAALFMTSLSTIAATTPSNKEIKMMDANSDGIVSKDEYMTYQEQMFDNMKQVDGGVSTKDMRSPMKKSSGKSAPEDNYNSSLNDKPIGTTTGRTDVNPKDATNGKKY